jgi:hypothetical protein
MNDALDAALGGGFCNCARGFDVQRLKILAAVLVHHRNEVHDRVSVFQRSID